VRGAPGAAFLFDCRASESDNVLDVHAGIANKVAKNEFRQVVFLADVTVTVEDAAAELRRNPIPRLDEILFIDQRRRVHQFDPRTGALTPLPRY
jgi:hypothetical protein